MKVQVKTGGGGVGFARKAAYEYEGTKYEADLKNGDIIKILDGGTVESNQNFPGESKNFKIKTRNGERKTGFNQKTINVLATEFGEETEEWINKDVNVIIWKTIIAGNKRDVAFFVTEGWKLDEYGELVKDGQTATKKKYEDVDEIPAGDIPF